ncbi:hypothetical protein N3K66_002911 [Trichothecium roseum]|uniref:Uncharacterized protein n=1 Tax=Trichothecium roseum TaxID=47278 RepID=A0ACC0V5I5_9HYPO|nr:hypothetical protein N3K66_002911 [Trichothecium roseum]
MAKQPNREAAIDTPARFQKAIDIDRKHYFSGGLLSRCMRRHGYFCLAAAGFAGTAASEALPAESIPMACVTICSPIVDLSSQCNRIFSSPGSSSSSESSPDAARASSSSESESTLTVSLGPLPTELEVDVWKREPQLHGQTLRQNQRQNDEEGEGEVGCFCGNGSIDVRGLVGACLGCVERFDDDSNVHIIEEACGFGFNASEKRYDATMDAVVGTLKVRTALSGAAGRMGVSMLAVAATVLGGFVLGCVA